MDNILDFLENIFGIFLFCIAISALFYNYKVLNNTMYTLKYNINSTNTLYEQDKPEILSVEITSADVVSTLMNGMEYDTEIDGLFISKESYEYSNFNYSIIKNGNYKKSYVLDGDGNIQRVIYNSY